MNRSQNTSDITPQAQKSKQSKQKPKSKPKAKTKADAFSISSTQDSHNQFNPDPFVGRSNQINFDKNEADDDFNTMVQTQPIEEDQQAKATRRKFMNMKTRRKQKQTEKQQGDVRKKSIETFRSGVDIKIDKRSEFRFGREQCKIEEKEIKVIESQEIQEEIGQITQIKVEIKTSEASKSPLIKFDWKSYTEIPESSDTTLKAPLISDRKQKQEKQLIHQIIEPQSSTNLENLNKIPSPQKHHPQPTYKFPATKLRKIFNIKPKTQANKTNQKWLEIQIFNLKCQQQLKQIQNQNSNIPQPQSTNTDYNTFSLAKYFSQNYLRLKNRHKGLQNFKLFARASKDYVKTKEHQKKYSDLEIKFGQKVPNRDFIVPKRKINGEIQRVSYEEIMERMRENGQFEKSQKDYEEQRIEEQQYQLEKKQKQQEQNLKQQQILFMNKSYPNNDNTRKIKTERSHMYLFGKKLQSPVSDQNDNKQTKITRAESLDRVAPKETKKRIRAKTREPSLKKCSEAMELKFIENLKKRKNNKQKGSKLGKQEGQQETKQQEKQEQKQESREERKAAREMGQQKVEQKTQ